MTMAQMYAKQGGVLVPTDVKGVVRVGGQLVNYGPPQAGIEESFAFPTPPTLPSNDDGQRLTLGTPFSLLAGSPDGSWVGNRIYTPSTAIPDLVSLAYYYDSTEEIARKSVLTPAIGQWVSVLFDAPIPVTAGLNYLAAYNAAKYAATGEVSLSWPYSTAHMTTRSGVGASRWLLSSEPTYPANSSSACYYVTPIVQFP